MSRTSSGIATSESIETSWPISSIGKIGVRSSGPAGSMVAGLSGGLGSPGRSGSRLTQWVGIASSGSVYLTVASLMRGTLTSMGSPAVSIVVATYNRSNVLELAIGSAVAQTFTDWEMHVVGDACTDDSERVISSFGDPRIRWTNLPVNHGDQSGPNNHGVRLARGRYIAFLNQDDLWFPDHLERSIAALEAA